VEKRGNNKSFITCYDLKILGCLLNNRELKIGEIESKTSGTSYHIRERIKRLESYGLIYEKSRGGKAIFISLNPLSKKFVYELLNFSRGKM
jgi:predicted transcriptional regulator